MNDLTAQTNKKYFLHPTFDLWALGLFSILLAFYSLTLRDLKTPIGNPAQWAFYFSFLINYPHFAASYRLFYKNFFSDFYELKSVEWILKIGFIWTAILCPVALIGFSIYAIQLRSEESLKILIYLMYLSVGWHYVKQTFGVGLLASSLHGYQFKNLERVTLRSSLLLLWILQWANSNQGSREFDFYGLKYLTQNVAPETVTILWILLAFSILSFVILLFKKYLDEGSKPPMIFFVIIGSMFVWYIPLFYHPLFFLWLPLLHSLQYLVVSHAYEQRKIEQTTAMEAEPKKQRYLWFWKNAKYMLVIFTLGAFGFELLPRMMDSAFGKPFTNFSAYFVTVNVFINVHHYFIDSWIWKRHYRDHLSIFKVGPIS